MGSPQPSSNAMEAQLGGNKIGWGLSKEKGMRGSARSLAAGEKKPDKRESHSNYLCRHSLPYPAQSFHIQEVVVSNIEAPLGGPTLSN